MTPSYSSISVMFSDKRNKSPTAETVEDSARTRLGNSSSA